MQVRKNRLTHLIRDQHTTPPRQPKHHPLPLEGHEGPPQGCRHLLQALLYLYLTKKLPTLTPALDALALIYWYWHTHISISCIFRVCGLPL